ncbi:MAG: alkaline phosphatase family protein [Gemmataceae bacterium]|nr:alkaline phosphatase family protein [Gemmataceae bacterium]
MFRRPLYDSFCFSRLPGIIERLLGQEDARERALPEDVLAGLPQRYDAVLFLFLDAFGWRFFEQFADDFPLLREVVARGRATRLTSQFPSTTAAHVTCIHTGLSVGQSGVYEWIYHEPRVGALISPLPFSFAGDKHRETLAAAGFSAADIFPSGPTIYERLAQAGVESFAYQPAEFARSITSTRMLRGATATFGYRTLPEALVNLGQHLLSRPPEVRRYYFLYADTIDSIGHRYGPESCQFAAEADAVCHSIQRFLVERVRGRVGETLLLVSADHGQVRTDPATTVYINEAIPGVETYLQQGRDGRPIRFAGSPRDLFLHVREDRLEELGARLMTLLEGRAEVWRTSTLIEEGLFGPVSERFLERVGNLVVLPYAGETVFWREEGRFLMDKLGHHGGLTPQEMDTGVYLLPLFS